MADPAQAQHLLGRLYRQVAWTADTELATLYEELDGYPAPGPRSATAHPGPDLGDLAATLRIRLDGRELAFYSTVATFGAPLDVTVAELAIESFVPADAATAEFLHAAR